MPSAEPFWAYVHSQYCQQIQPLSDFSAEAYMGTWFEQQHTRNESFQDDTDQCVEAIYYDLKADGSFKVYNSYQDKDFSERSGVTFNACCPLDGSGWCVVGRTCSMVFENTRPNYQILDTDYTTYSIVYDCNKIKEYLWILTRDSEISDDFYESLVNKTHELMPDYNFQKQLDQEYQGQECTYQNW